jgi:uncharacterized RDD family membrane protein YckC
MESKERSIHKQLLRLRTWSFTADLFLIFVLNKGTIFAFRSFLKTVYFHLPGDAQMAVLKGLPAVDLLLMMVVFWSYFTISYFLGNGQTPGKMIFGLKTFSSTSKNMTLSESILRTSGYFFCYSTGIIFFAIPFMRKDRKGIPDWVSGTWVNYRKFVVEEKAPILLPPPACTQIIPLPAPISEQEEDENIAA